MDVLIVIGDQDTFHEGDPDIDASPIAIADILRDEGLTALFVVQARRAEILREQGRRGVIAALRHHEIGLHGRDVHPVLPEAVEGLDWHAGVQALLELEGGELDTVGQVFDVAPVCSSQHRNHAAPQIFAVARRRGMPYLFGFPAAPPLHSVSWYAGALNVPFNSPVPNFLGFFPAVFDDALPDATAFATLFGRLREHVQRALAVGLPLLVVFVCHPERLWYVGAVEQWQYGNGRTHGRAAVPPGSERRRSRAEFDSALGNFRTVVRYLRDTPGLEPTTVRDVQRRYGTAVASVSRAELAALAGQAVDGRCIPIGATLSAADSLLGFAAALARFSTHGELPPLLPRQDALGPLRAPPLAPELPRLEAGELVSLARSVVQAAAETGHLPAVLAVDGHQVGLGSVYGVLAEAYRVASGGGDPLASALDVGVWPRYPNLAPALGDHHRLCIEDPLVRPDLSTDALALHARLQTWTLKPAHRGTAASIPDNASARSDVGV